MEVLSFQGFHCTFFPFCLADVLYVSVVYVFFLLFWELMIVCLVIVGGNQWQMYSLLCVLCSMLSKEQGITVLGFCVVYDITTSSRVRREKYATHACLKER